MRGIEPRNVARGLASHLRLKPLDVTAHSVHLALSPGGWHLI